MTPLPHRPRLFWETVRHLRPAQIHGRLWFRLARPRPDLCPAPERRNIDPARWTLPARRPQSMTGPDRFSFLGETASLSDAGWDDPAFARLWRYNLHYFDDLNAETAGERTRWHEALLARWIAENPPGTGTGWEPYPVSLRIVNWIKWDLAGNPLPPEAAHSLAVQARWLTRRLERHLLGNHLFANAKALVFAGCWFAGEEAERWRRLGMRILDREIDEQILPDGGQFERSPMYHALALEDMLDLANLLAAAGLPMPGTWRARISAMQHWLAAMSHPDGEIGFFNDAAIGIAPAPVELARYARAAGYLPPQSPRDGCTHLAESGYVRWQDRNAVALLDLAPVGPDYLPGHAHADTLSFELAVQGRRLLVNSGTSLYETGPERQRQRGTAAHNTVEVDGADSSEVWAGFRVARRARPIGASIQQQQGETVIACAHDGYLRLPGRVLHHRQWRLAAGRLTVEDRVEGGHSRAVARFHFHPGWTCRHSAEDGLGSAIQDSSIVSWRVGKGKARLQPATWHPEFGRSVPSSRLELVLEDGQCNITFTWAEA